MNAKTSLLSAAVLSLGIFSYNFVLAASPTHLGVGDQAPDFALPDQDGKITKLADFANKENVVLYFYPKDDVGVCKKEACSFRDQYDQFTAAGATVLGVSSDSAESHKRFVDRRHLPFKLLSDTDGKVRKLYGVPKSAAGLLPGRETFVIDKQGTIKLTFNSMLDANKHVSQALDVLKQIGSPQHQ